MLLTKNYQLIGSTNLTYGQLRTYAKYNSQNTSTNKTTYSIKSTYYSSLQVSFSNGTNTLDGTTKSYGYSTFTGEVLLQELTRTLTHNEDGTSPTKTIVNSWTATFGGNGTVTSQITVPKINRLSTITVNNNTSFAVDTNENVSNTIPVKITKYVDSYTQKLKITMENNQGNQTVVRDYVEFDSDTLTFSQTELNTIYNNTDYKFFKLIFALDTYNGSTKLGTTTTEVSSYLSNTDLKPTFNDFVYADWNQTTLALTGNGYTLIKGYSTAGITVAGPNIATAHKGATISKYTAINGSQNDDYVMGEYPATMQIEKVTDRTMSVWAIDSRGESTKVDKLATNWIDYKDIEKISFTAERKNGGTSSGVTLKLSGNIFDGSFGAVENSIKSATYKYKKTTDGEDAWIEGTTSLNVVKNGSNYSLEQDIAGDLGALGFDQESSYDIYVEVEDQLSKAYDTFTLGVGSPAIDIYGNCVSVGAPYDENLGGRFQLIGHRAEELFENNIITVGMFGSNQSLTSTSTTGNTINLNTIIAQIGTNLSFNSNSKSVVVGEGISKVLVSGLVTVSDASSNPQSRSVTFGFGINKNNSIVAGRSFILKPTGVGGSFFAMTIPTMLVEVEEGDKLTLVVTTSATQTNAIMDSDSGKYNYLTVQVVE